MKTNIGVPAALVARGVTVAGNKRQRKLKRWAKTRANPATEDRGSWSSTTGLHAKYHRNSRPGASFMTCPECNLETLYCEKETLWT